LLGSCAPYIETFLSSSSLGLFLEEALLSFEEAKRLESSASGSKEDRV
jgi:hypothetical protein